MKIGISILLILSLFCHCYAANFSVLKNSQQLVLVISQDWDSSSAKLFRYQKNEFHSHWQRVGQPISVVLGKNGMAWSKDFANSEGPIKREGDLRTPAGVFSLGKAFGFQVFNDQISMPYFQIKNDTECVDDSSSIYYNQIVNRHSIKNPDWNSAELMRSVPLYQLGMSINYNVKPAVSQAGSCIFIHQWRNSEIGTAGCLAMSRDHLLQLLNWLKLEGHPVIAFFTIKNQVEINTLLSM